MKALQKFSKEYLEECKNMQPHDIVQFIENFRLLHGEKLPQASGPSKLISIKVPHALLDAFKSKAKLQNVPYQTQIKKLMSAWLKTG